MILVDTSAWIEFLSDTSSPVCDRVQRELSLDIAITDPILMEVLAGARDDSHLLQLRRWLARGTRLSTQPADFEQAAVLYRQCRKNGETVRKLVDCLIAAISIRNTIPLLHQDQDFEVLARHTLLELA
ncbi:MAG: PIN domain nuclease [Gammaproteobacteria bacterium]|nr:PIN domain nuclease [Gammaproteobacteria bacterium]